MTTAVASRRMKTLLLGVAVAATSTTAVGQNGATAGEWRYYGGDAGTTRYSPLDQINKGNVKDLQDRLAMED